jgi:uncharacterized protein involved in exopolysaccharide biosynthesis/Mrp family chromosome partitioning ATPase
MHAPTPWEVEPPDTAPAAFLGLRQALGFLLDHALFLGGGLVLGALAGLLLQANMTPVFESKGKFAIDELPYRAGGAPLDADSERELVQTLILSVPSREMEKSVARQLGVERSQVAFTEIDLPLRLTGAEPRVNLEVTATRNSRIGVITATSQSAEFAARAANAVLRELETLNRVAGRIKQTRVDLDLVEAKSKNLLDELVTLSTERINLEQENTELRDYTTRGLPLEAFSAFAKDATLNNLKTQLILVQSEYDSLASTRTRGAQLVGKRAELAGLRGQIAAHARGLAEALRSQLEISRTQEKNVQEELKAAQDAVKRLSEQCALLLQGYGDPAAAQNLGDEPAAQSNAVVIVDRASPGTRPIRPRLALNLLFGLLLGGVFGFGGATLRAVLDNRISTPSRVETLTGLPCLAALPRPRRASRGPRHIFTHAPFPLGLGFLRSWLIRSALGNNAARIVGFAPVSPDFSSSRTVADLAILLAEAEKRTLVVDLHLDHPAQPRLLGVTHARLAAWLASDDPVEDYIGYTTVRELAVLAAERRVPGVENLLSRRPLSETLPGILDKWDFILIDAPAITTDSALMLTLPAGSPLLLAADARRSRAESILQAARHARGPRWALDGVVLLNARAK